MTELVEQSPGAEHVDPKIQDAMTKFQKEKDAPVVAYISKMVSVPESELPENKRRGGGALSAEEARELARKKRAEFARAQAAQNGGDDDMSSMTQAFGATSVISEDGPQDAEEDKVHEKADPEHLIGFARIYSGTLNVGDEIYVLPPKFTPAAPHAQPEPQKVTITALYLLMGRGLEPLTTVPAGCVFGIGGLAGHVLKSGTICTQLEGSVNLAGVNLGSQPIVRVALEPENPSDLGKMITGLKLLVQSDPCAQYEVLESGEHVILTAGELHLERCLKDLRERFARCEIQAGAPIVPYRESIVAAAEMNAPQNKDLPRGTVETVTASKFVTIRLRVRPLPAPVTEFLAKNAGAIKRLYAERSAEEQTKRDADVAEEAGEEVKSLDVEVDVTETGQALTIKEFRTQLLEAFAEAKGESEVWAGVAEKIAAFGPRRTGPNLLIDETGLRVLPHV